MKTILMLLGLYFLSIEIIHSQSKNVEYEIVDSLFIGMDVQKVVWDSKDTLWMIISDGLYKSYNNSLYQFTNENSNLTSENIKEIAIDSKDTIWLVTEKGLVKFDHVNFTTYDSTNTNIPHYYYHELAIDKDDNIWFSSSDAVGGGRGGLIKYDKTNWHVYTPDNSSLPVPVINSIEVDKAKNVWVACIGRSTYIPNIVKISGDEWTIYNEGNIGISMYSFFTGKTLVVDDKDNLYVKIDYSTSSSFNIGKPSILKYDGTDWSIIDTVSFMGDWAKTLGCDGMNNIWKANALGSYLSYYDGDKWNQWGELDNSIFKRDIITGIDNNLWLCTTKGIYIVEAKTSGNTNSFLQTANEIKIYPNPTARFITIDFDQFDHCNIYNIVGTFIAKSKSQTIDISDNIAGIYLFRISDKNGNCTIKKVILN